MQSLPLDESHDDQRLDLRSDVYKLYAVETVELQPQASARLQVKATDLAYCQGDQGK